VSVATAGSSADIEVFEKQAEFLAAPERFTGFIGGTGSGKTTAGSYKALIHAQPGTLGLIAAPTYRMLQDATLRKFQEACGPWIVDYARADMIAHMSTGAEILFRTADNPDRLRGDNLHWAWLDEAALCNARAWDVLIARLRADGKAGDCWITTTPRGRNWVYERRGEMRTWRVRTRDNPYLNEEFVGSLEAAYTGLFAQQELEGKFVAFEGLVYDEFDRAIHVVEQHGESPVVRYVAGVDEGYTNPGVVLVGALDNDGRIHIVEEFYERRVLQPRFVEVCADISRRYNAPEFFVDPSAAGLIAAMRVAELRVIPADNRVNDGIQEVKSRLAIAGDGMPRLTFAPTCVNGISEMESYPWAQDRQGRALDRPVKQNDHFADSLRYVCLGIRETQGFAYAAI